MRVELKTLIFPREFNFYNHYYTYVFLSTFYRHFNFRAAAIKAQLRNNSPKCLPSTVHHPPSTVAIINRRSVRFRSIPPSNSPGYLPYTGPGVQSISRITRKRSAHSFHLRTIEKNPKKGIGGVKTNWIHGRNRASLRWVN